MNDSIENRYRSSPFSGGNAAFLDELYEQYLQDPDSLTPAWREYFSGFEAANPGQRDIPHGPVIARLKSQAHQRRSVAAAESGSKSELSPEMADKQAAVMRLIEAYRGRGHLVANLDPLGLQRQNPFIPDPVDDLDPAFHGLTEADMDTQFSTKTLVGADRMALRDIVAMLKKVYCGSIGFEYMHVTTATERRWLKEYIEGTQATPDLKKEEKITILEQLSAAEGLEKYLHTRYVGQKRFSLEGGETMIPMLRDLVQRGGESGLQEFVVGMAHRGRLNVLVNVLGKSPKEMFSEFEGVYNAKVENHSGDVKYHLGFSSDIKTAAGNVHLALAFNPSHLEIVDPVVEGSVRARQERRGDLKGDKVLPVLIHGDASFAGQGVVMETLQLSQARGFSTGGTVHIICNNQIGFTISNPLDARSTPYCSDVAKMLEAPVFHVNGDDAEAVIYTTRLALKYRMKFHKDVVVDLVCYRRHGHNEADEPSATQPIMYKTIKAHPTARTVYADKLVEENLLDKETADAKMEDYRSSLSEADTMTPVFAGLGGNDYTVDWSKYDEAGLEDTIDTAMPLKHLKALGKKISTLPDDLVLQSRVKRVIDERRKMLAGEKPLDWGAAETLAYATLVNDRFNVRLSGQDSGRGTFFHRHAILHNQKDGDVYIPLTHVDDDQGKFWVVDSLLSEAAVVGFEYGYSTADPNSLVIWEAQFGDFANGAQVVIDQFISSGETKWGRLCGLTLLLPHGYEGQGPEHSSARLERYLQLCAQHNMQVCVPSTPAQMFHMLRRQMVRPLRKPLVVMTPKSLLRHKLAVSDLSVLADGHFHTVISEIDDVKPDNVQRIVFCSGKVYYDLVEARRDAKRDDVAIIRIEQPYPFPANEYEAEIKRYKHAQDVIWCQEEPENQGAWYQIRHRLSAPLKQKHHLIYAGRAASASTAAGYVKMHLAQQKRLITEALGEPIQARKAAS